MLIENFEKISDFFCERHFSPIEAAFWAKNEGFGEEGGNFLVTVPNSELR